MKDYLYTKRIDKEHTEALKKLGKMVLKYDKIRTVRFSKMLRNNMASFRCHLIASVLSKNDKKYDKNLYLRVLKD